jgi:Fe2+ transport system protein B
MPGIQPLQESRPVPDPTTLTTQQLLRELAATREVIEARIDGMDKAIVLFQTAIDKIFPLQVDSAIRQLRELHEEKFRSIAIQFAERDTRTEQTSKDSKVAVDAALQAAKEAVGEQNKSNALAIAKSEAAFTKQIDQIGTIIDTLAKGLDGKIDDIKTRLQAIESYKKGTNDVWAYLISGISLIIAALAIFLKH